MTEDENRPTQGPEDRLQEEDSVPRGQRLRDGLDPDDTAQPNRVHTGGRLKDGAEMTEEEIRARGLWRWPRGKSPSTARPDDPVWERARREGIGLTRPEDEQG